MPDNIPVCEQTHAAIMEELSLRLDGLLRVLPRNSPVIYLDVPLHFNVGDLLINSGTEEFFRRSDLTPIKRSTFFDACTVNWDNPESASLKPSFIAAIDKLDPSIPIVLHGGGSLGDIYPDLQAMREAVVRAFPVRRIILFPQSLHFDDRERQARSLNSMLAHRDIHVFVRDRSSLEAIRAVSPAHGTLMPDMAHALWSPFERFRGAPATRDTLTLCRRDAETQNAMQENSFDWPDIIRPADTLVWRIIRKAMHRDFGSEHWRVRAWYGVRDRIIWKSIQRFSSYRAIETDRLHGLILGALLGRSVMFRDNRYAKLARYVDEWLALSPLIETAACEGTRK